MAEVRPYGSWTSSITSKRIAAGARRVSQPQLDGDRIGWLEARPSEGGRQLVMTVEPGGEPRSATPDEVNVRSLVHEYGGGDYLLREGRIFYVDVADGRLHDRDEAWGEPGARLADPELSPDGRWLVAVEERAPEGSHTNAGADEDAAADGEPVNRLCAHRMAGEAGAVSGGGSGAGLRFAEGHDFVASPRFSPDGRQLAFIAWEHPDMPWDGTGLYLVDWDPASGPAGKPRLVAGGPGESIVEPRFSPAGVLCFVSDRSGWWNLYQWKDGEVVALCPREAEFGRPLWVFGISGYGFIDEGEILCRYGERCRDRLARLDVASGRLRPIELPYTWIDGLRVEGGRAVLLGAGPDRASEVASLDLETDALEVVRRSVDLELPELAISHPEEIRFESAGGREAYGFFYPPTHPDFEGPDGERPPLLVKSHGGPTSSTYPIFDLRIQYWTSRGFAVVDVNYAGSTGYGREYRERLTGTWGLVDVEDCVAAARTLADQGRVDRDRMAISGGSAGGYTTLCALTFHDVFAAGASHYGIGDLEALARDTHKFESRYLDKLVAPYPEGADVYRARSPLRHAEGLRCPVIFFQGLEDRVVPPNQAEAMVEVLARRGIPHAYVPFEGEQHGFRRAENICTALDGELYFYSRVFDFGGVERPEPVSIVE